VPENSPAEGDFLEERAVNAGQAVTVGVHQHVALHAGQDLFDVRRRLVARIRTELQFGQRLAGPANAFRALFFSCVLKQEGIGQCSHDAQSVLGVRALLFALLFQFFGMVDETFDPLLFRMALLGSQRFAIVGDHQAGSSLLGFDIESCRRALGRDLGAAKQKVGSVVVGRLNFVLHCFAHQFHRIAIRRNCRWLPGKTGRSEQQNPSAGVSESVDDGVARDSVDDRNDRTEHVDPV
jgi:hypothetical protein